MVGSQLSLTLWKTQPMVYCHNLEGLICHIASERNVEVADLLKLIGLDRGQGHTQLTLQPHQDSDLQPQDVKQKRRRRRSEGLSEMGYGGRGRPQAFEKTTRTLLSLFISNQGLSDPNI